MFGFGKKKDIAVEYVEAGKRSPLTTAKVPVDQLPERFEQDSVMEVKGQRWTVVAAVPETKDEFGKTGRLQIFLSRVVELVPPGDILFSLPTINDDIGITDRESSEEGAFVIHEDDWRQIEFVSKSLNEKVQMELRQIERILRDHNKGGGYDRLHVRKALPTPLANAKITRATIKELFGILREYKGVSMTGYSGLVEDGFALDVGGAGVLWGETDGKGNITSLNLAPSAPGSEKSPDVVDFCARNNLLLVNWPVAKAI